MSITCVHFALSTRYALCLIASLRTVANYVIISFLKKQARDALRLQFKITLILKIVRYILIVNNKTAANARICYRIKWIKCMPHKALPASSNLSRNISSVRCFVFSHSVVILT